MYKYSLQTCTSWQMASKPFCWKNQNLKEIKFWIWFILLHLRFVNFGCFTNFIFEMFLFGSCWCYWHKLCPREHTWAQHKKKSHTWFNLPMSRRWKLHFSKTQLPWVSLIFLMVLFFIFLLVTFMIQVGMYISYYMVLHMDIWL